MKSFICFLSFLILLSCAKSDKAQIDSAKKQALYYLTKSKCTDAREALDEVDYQSDDAVFISLYSDTYACEAGYGQLTTALDNMANITANVTSLFQTLASFSSSQGQSAADSTSYTKLMQAIQVILNSGAGSVARITKFGETKAGDLHLQLLLLLTVEMGKYFGYYGDVDTNGTKGGGGNWNCIAQYTDANALTHLAVNGADSCTNGANTSSTETQTSDSAYARRLCEGTILFNNFQDVLSNITFSSNSSELGELTSVGAVLNTIETTAAGVEAAVADYKDILDQTTCETTAATKGAELQRYFALVIENNHN